MTVRKHGGGDMAKEKKVGNAKSWALLELLTRLRCAIGSVAIALGVLVAVAAVLLYKFYPDPKLELRWSGIAILIAAALATLALVAWALLAPRLKKSTVKYSDQEERIFAATRQITLSLIGFGLLGVVGLALWCWGQSQDSNPAGGTFLTYFGSFLLVACASGGAGAVFGFLFGVPRTIEAANRATLLQQTNQDGAAVATQATLAANTNLERVSDWLTTLLVGATLVQIKDIASWIGGLGDKFASGDGSTVIVVLIIFAFCLGFLGVYLMTRLYLTYALHETLSNLTGVTPAGTTVAALLDHALDVRSPEAVKTAVEALQKDGGKTLSSATAQGKVARLYGLSLSLQQKADPKADTAATRAKIIEALTAAAKDDAVKTDLQPHLDAADPKLFPSQKDLVALDKDPEARKILGIAPPTDKPVVTPAGTTVAALLDHALDVRSPEAVKTAVEALQKDGGETLSTATAQGKVARLYGLSLSQQPKADPEADTAATRAKIIEALTAAAKDDAVKTELQPHLDAADPKLPPSQKDLVVLDKDTEARKILGMASPTPAAD